MHALSAVLLEQESDMMKVFILWQQRGRKNSLQLWTPFQKWHLEDKMQMRKKWKLARKFFPVPPPFSFICICFLLYPYCNFYSYLHLCCFLKWFNVTRASGVTVVWVTNSLLLSPSHISLNPFNFLQDFSIQAVLCLFYLSSCHYECWLNVRLLVTMFNL